MALTLDATLQANQDGNVRHPLVEVKSYNAVDDIPFNGQTLTTESINETNPSAIVHSSGRLATCYIYGPDGSSLYLLRLTYSDVSRTQFYTIDLGTAAAPIILWCSICELTNENVGVIWIENDAANHLYRLKYRIITETGVSVSTAEIANWSHDTYTNGLSVIYNSSATIYQLVYAKISGANYSIYYRSSSDFTTWSAESALSIGGLTATKKLYNPCLMLDSGHSTLWIWLCYVESVGPNSEELINAYYSTSADNGTTWANATQNTTYTTYSTVASYPSSLLKSSTTMYAAFTETAKSLKMNTSTTGWQGKATSGGYGFSHFDSVRRKLFIWTWSALYYNSDVYILQVDVDTWTIDDYWSTASTPAIKSAMRCGVGSGSYIPLWSYLYPVLYGDGLFQVINASDNTVTTYAFNNIAGIGVSKNVEGTWTTLTAYPTLVQVDETNDRLWIVYCPNYGSHWFFLVGYIDTSGSSPYNYTEIIYNSGNENPSGAYAKIFIAEEYVCHVNNPNWMKIYDFSGNLLKTFSVGTHVKYPAAGISCLLIHQGKLYGNINYTSGYSQEDQRGIVEIDPVTEAVTTYRPTFATADDYYFNDGVSISDHEILWSSSVYGAAVFDTSSKTWTQRSNTTAPGLTSPSSDAFAYILYDSTAENFFTTIASNGVYYIPLLGTLNTTYYRIATYSAGAWSWTANDTLISGSSSFNVKMVKYVSGSDTYVYAFWVHDGKPEYSIYWDTEEPPFDLTPYWINGTDFSLKWSIDGSFNTLEMELAHGHLFDQFNSGSAWSKYVEKGRKLVVRLGEIISSTEYWQDQGTFVVTERKMGGYEKGKYPTMAIVAEDKRTLWQHKDVIATDAYADLDPDAILEDLLIDQGFADDSGDFAWVVIDNETHLEHQWMETPLLDIVNQIVDRYGYFLVIDVDDKISARKIALNNAVDHTYANNNQLLTFSPDDTYSDFVNRVIVVGQELDFTEVTYAEEAVKTLNGTIGWWGCKNEYTVWYSDDHSRVCRDPRLKVIESVTSIGFAFHSGLSEEISYEDVNEQYCIVTVEAPNLIDQLIAGTVAWAAMHFLPDLVEAVGFIENVGFTIRVGTAAQAIALFVVLNTISAVGNFQYEIYACPVGHVRRSVQATADDEDCQTAIGQVISKKIEDPLCYSVSDCQIVANHERDVVKAQRKRVALTKISHLQDQAGDTIVVPHPFSGQDISIFITDLTRTYNKSNSGASCVDSINGWVL